MPIEISSLKQLDATKVQAMVATLSQLMAERHPEVELTRGVFHDLVLYFDGLLNAAIQENIDRVLQSKSLLKITETPDLADTDLVDQVLSNYNIVRDTGTPASGTITVIFNANLRTEIATTVRFALDSSDTIFVPTDTFVVLPSTETPVNNNERKMIAVGDGTYAANITVTATAVGAAGNIKRGTLLTPNNVINNVASIYANSDFIRGKDPSTNEEYLRKLSSGLAAKTIGGRQNYVAAIMNEPEFANIPNLSILGCGDPEQQRDQHSLFPVSGGGKVDIYAHTNSYAQEQEHLLEATYIGPYVPPSDQSGDCAEQALAGGTATGTVWQVTIARDLAPGFYEVVRVVDPALQPAARVNYSVAQDTRGVDISELDFVPDILYLHESAYTRYQTATIRFVNTAIQPNGTVVAGQTKKVYAVTTAGLPLIAELQDHFSARDVRARGTDVLVKAAVPCFTKISFEIRKSASEAVPDLAAMKQEIVDAVAAIGFSGQLHSSVIVNAAHKYLTGRQALGAIDMFGRIRRPDGTTTYVRDNTILVLPADNQRLVTGRTTAFIVGVDDVSISVTTAGLLN
jgi:uncharacterized phage protein gp47/JayE